MVELKITIDESTVTFGIDGDEEDMNFANIMTGVLLFIDEHTQGFLKTVQASEECTDEIYEGVKADIYDNFNMYFGQILENIIPTPEGNFNANLTTEAVLKAENELIAEKYEELKADGTIS